MAYVDTFLGVHWDLLGVTLWGYGRTLVGNVGIYLGLRGGTLVGYVGTFFGVRGVLLGVRGDLFGGYVGPFGGFNFCSGFMITRRTSPGVLRARRVPLVSDPLKWLSWLPVMLAVVDDNWLGNDQAATYYPRHSLIHNSAGCISLCYTGGKSNQSNTMDPKKHVFPHVDTHKNWFWLLFSTVRSSVD